MSEGRTPLAPVVGLKRGGDLPPPPARRPVAAVPGTAPTTAATIAPSTADKGPTATRRASVTAETVRDLGLSLPVSLAERFKAKAKGADQTQADVLMDAVVAHQDNLRDLVDTARSNTTRNDGLFIRNTAQPSNEPFVTVSLRMKSPNVEVLDQLVTDTDAASRSQLVAVALQAYL